MPKIYDVIVIGSGAGGGMYAKVLTEAGASVLLIDAGSHQIDRDIRHHQWPWELPYRNQYQQDKEYTVQLPTIGHTVGGGDREHITLFDGSAHNSYYNDHFWAKRRDWKYTFPENKPYRWVRVRALGGKTNCWDANTGRWGPIEFQPASYDGYDVDWPITYEEMAPWYSKTERLIGVSGPDTKSEHCPTGEWLPTIRPTCPEAQLARGADRLGLYAFMTPKAAITRDYNGRSKCHYCGRCGHGCDSGSKFTTVGVLLPPTMATGRLTLQLNSVVREVMVGSDGRAKGVAYIDRYTFQEGEARGRNVVLCASAIETARILLNSKSSHFPQGLANSSGQVGRDLVENVTASVSGYFSNMRNRAVANEDGWGTGMLIAPFVNIDQKTRSKKFLRRYMTSLGGGFGMGSGGAARGGELLGSGYKRDVRSWYGTGVGVSASGEGLQSRDNYVDIDPEVKDVWGIPAARIQMTFGENEQAMVKDMVERCIDIMEAAGGVVTGWQVSPSIPGGQIHEQGTCRMGNDPKRFVTNRWGQCHDVPNLLLGDGSLHVTCSTENPTLTILALSMRNAEHLAESVRKHEW